MLKTVEIIEGLENKYADMIRLVNIPDFYKCIAQFSGLRINNVSDDVIKRYLITWAKNKYRFFEFLGGKLRVDTPFEYDYKPEELKGDFEPIQKDFIGYAPWLAVFDRQNSNIVNVCRMNWDDKQLIHRFFPQIDIDGMKITHFLKEHVHAPDELVTRVAAITENNHIIANHTISIDPVDMMLASENPYNWNSCYRLETPNDASHADGCLAAVLDDSSLITYVWNNEGKFSLYNNYTFKSIRYKRMRQWIAISPNHWCLNFNDIYPGKSSYDEELCSSIRGIVEAKVAAYKGYEDKWVHNYHGGAEREYYYGYSEFDNGVYMPKELGEDAREFWSVYNVEIECPCGCGHYLCPSYDCDEEEYSYNGDGFIYENFIQRYWCEEADEYCDHCPCAGECDHCWAWRRNHPICPEDCEECDNKDWNIIDDEGEIRQDYDDCQHCMECPRWKACHPDQEEEEEENND